MNLKSISNFTISTNGGPNMNKNDHTPLYQYEDELLSISIGKPSQGSGAFIAVDGNIQFGFMDEQFIDDLI